MASYSEDLEFDIVEIDVEASSRAEALSYCAKLIAESMQIAPEVIENGLLERRGKERACQGDGLAIADLKVFGMKLPKLVFLRFKEPVDFNAPDGCGVDILCALVSPETYGPRHLCRLSRITRLMKHPDLHAKIMEANDEDEVRSLLHHPEGWLMAA